MNRTVRSLGAPVIGIVVVVLLFAWLNSPVRNLEARVAGSLIRLLFPHSRIFTFDNVILFRPKGDSFVEATLVPSCSSLASVLTISCLAFLTPRRRYTHARKAAAVGTAVAAVAIGNMVRIVASLAAGLLAGSSALVFFHDGFGSVFSFASILVGYMLFLGVLLPKEVEARQPEVIDRVVA